jgi:hypothetical protein
VDYVCLSMRWSDPTSRARSSDDPLLANKAILDPYLTKHGYYKNLPNAKCVQLPLVYHRSLIAVFPSVGFSSCRLTRVRVSSSATEVCPLGSPGCRCRLGTVSG